ncbi:hypothetical protein [Trebonia kvetii]|uniref:hypothetical protein n=1 Tax=Trebonia kvetii TaxID=2480626 RepID=UPI001FE91A78|nr:hypothetical protein [Trebonia kvetii]
MPRRPGRARRLVVGRSVFGHKQAADDEVSERVRNLAVGFEVGLHVLLHRERDVGMPDALG